MEPRVGWGRAGNGAYRRRPDLSHDDAIVLSVRGHWKWTVFAWVFVPAQAGRRLFLPGSDRGATALAHASVRFVFLGRPADREAYINLIEFTLTPQSSFELSPIRRKTPSFVNLDVDCAVPREKQSPRYTVWREP